jgi:two-component system OmpR family sensor kinase
VPIRLRLALVFAAAAVVLVAASGWLLVHLLDHELNTSVDATLDGRARVIAGILNREASGKRSFFESRSPHGASPDEQRARFVGHFGLPVGQLVSASGRVLASLPPTRSKPLLTSSQLATSLRHHAYFDTVLAGSGGPFRLLAEPDPGRHDTALILGASIGSSADLEHRLLVDIAFALVPVALVAGIGAWFLAGAALAPVERLRRQAASLSATDADASLAVPNTSDEVAALARTMNDLLARMQHALRRQRSFVSDAGHELRTPLAALEAELELATRPSRSVEELREAIANARADASRLQALTENLLVLARSDEHALPLERTITNLGEVLTAARRSARVQADRRGVRVVLEHKGPIEAEVDPLRIRQVVDNLLSNALRHAPQGSVVAIRAEQVDGRVTLSVRDEGPGFPDDFLPVAFERFNRPDIARGREGGGAGLGLAIVKAIAEAHGGSVRAANLEPRGAEVVVTLPMAKS